MPETLLFAGTYRETPLLAGFSGTKWLEIPVDIRLSDATYTSQKI
jgi:hypothetical protein